MGDVPVYLLNRDKMTQSLLKDVVHTPEMAFSLISVRHLDDANCTVLSKDGICMIKNPAGHIMAMIPHSNGLYWIFLSNIQPKLEYAAIDIPKMDINVAHRKFGHIAHVAIKHAISKGFILGFDMDVNSKSKFCEACAKAKSTIVPFPKESHQSYKVRWTSTLGPVGASISKKSGR